MNRVDGVDGQDGVDGAQKVAGPAQWQQHRPLIGNLSHNWECLQLEPRAWAFPF